VGVQGSTEFFNCGGYSLAGRSEALFEIKKNIVTYKPVARTQIETNNETTVLIGQQLRKYATLLELFLGSDLREILEVLLEAAFSIWSASRSYYSTD
jgi:hypothetical protein